MSQTTVKQFSCISPKIVQNFASQFTATCMKLVSFNLFRTLGLPNISNIKPEDFQKQPQVYIPQLEDADWVLFPEYWQLNSLIYGLGCKVFPSESSYRTGHDKIEMTRVCQLLFPDNVPTTWIAQNTTEEAERLWELMDTPFVAKLPKASQGEGVWLIQCKREWLAYQARTDSIYVQEYLPINKDLRIVVVGEEILTAYWRHQSDRSFHTNVSRGGQVSFEDVPSAALDFVLQLAKDLGINHAGFDVAMVGDHPFLLEFNRLFGNQGVPGGGKTISDTILRYLIAHQDDDKPINPNRPRRLKIAV